MRRFNDLIDLHGRLAQRIKRYEQVMKEFPVPVEVLNEFRYAERSTLHMLQVLLQYVDLDAVEEDDHKKLEHFFQQTEHALRCGYHDLVDGLVQELTLYLDEITDGLSAEAIEAMGDYRNQLLDDLEECQRLIASSRKDLDTRDDAYDEIYEEWYDKLLQHAFTLKETFVPKIMQLQKEHEDEKRELIILQEQQSGDAERRHLANRRLSILGLVVTTVLSLLALIATLIFS